jgi:hypothetical protein
MPLSHPAHQRISSDSHRGSRLANADVVEDCTQRTGGMFESHVRFRLQGAIVNG